MSRKLWLLSGMFCVMVWLLGVAASQASAGEAAALPAGGPAQTANARLTNVAGTPAAAATRVAGTAAAAATKAAGTAPAAATVAAAMTRAGAAVVAATGLARTSTALAPTLQAAGTKLGPTAMVLATSLAHTATALAPTLQALTKVPTDEAANAITAYGFQVLGINVSVKKATGWTGTINKSLTQTSAGSSAQAATVKIAGKTYEALLGNGAASLSYGSGTISGDVTVDVQGSSLGVYSLVISGTTAINNAEAALAAAKASFPALKDLAYKPYPVSTGYAWYFKGSVNGYDPKTKKATMLAEAVVLYVAPAGKVANVSATVGRGDFASQIKLP